MEPTDRFEEYPLETVLVSNFVSLAVYGIGLFILAGTGPFFWIPYLVFILAMEFRLLRYHCPNCWYWGKTCAFGKGRISALFFRKGIPEKFCAKPMTWRAMIPDILISLIPLVAGIVLLVNGFNPLLLAALLLLVLLTTSGSGYIRGTLACNHCKQAELGCPALKLFERKAV